MSGDLIIESGIPAPKVTRGIRPTSETVAQLRAMQPGQSTWIHRTRNQANGIARYAFGSRGYACRPERNDERDGTRIWRLK